MEDATDLMEVRHTLRDVVDVKGVSTLAFTRRPSA
jgi:hypothetical protein